jgi:hypothetical protein
MGIAEADARWLFQQLIIAVDYCHRLGIANRDIKVPLLQQRFITACAGKHPELFGLPCCVDRRVLQMSRGTEFSAQPGLEFFSAQLGLHAYNVHMNSYCSSHLRLNPDCVS